MNRASPITTASVTDWSGWSDVPDFSAYFRAYDHILSMFACDGPAWTGSAIRVSLEGRDGLVDQLGVEAGQPLVADQQHGQRREPELHQLLARRRIAADVLLHERNPLRSEER